MDVSEDLLKFMIVVLSSANTSTDVEAAKLKADAITFLHGILKTKAVTTRPELVKRDA